MGLGALFGAAGGTAGSGGGRALGKLYGKLVGQSYDDILRGLTKTRPAVAAGASVLSQLPEELVSGTAEWIGRRATGLEDTVARYVAIGVFLEGFLTAETTAATGYAETSRFTR